MTKSKRLMNCYLGGRGAFLLSLADTFILELGEKFFHPGLVIDAINDCWRWIDTQTISWQDLYYYAHDFDSPNVLYFEQDLKKPLYYDPVSKGFATKSRELISNVIIDISCLASVFDEEPHFYDVYTDDEEELEIESRIEDFRLSIFYNQDYLEEISQFIIKEYTGDVEEFGEAVDIKAIREIQAKYYLTENIKILYT